MEKRRIRVRKKRQNSLAMVLVTMVVVTLMVVMAVNNHGMESKLESYKSKEQSLMEQIEEENQRKEEIEDFKKYTKTKKYIEDIARDKLGLVYEDEIIIKTDEE